MIIITLVFLVNFSYTLFDYVKIKEENNQLKEKYIRLQQDFNNYKKNCEEYNKFLEVLERIEKEMDKKIDKKYRR